MRTPEVNSLRKVLVVAHPIILEPHRSSLNPIVALNCLLCSMFHATAEFSGFRSAALEHQSVPPLFTLLFSYNAIS